MAFLAAFCMIGLLTMAGPYTPARAPERPPPMAFLAAFCMIGLLTMAGPYTPPPMAMAAIAMATGLDTIALSDSSEAAARSAGATAGRTAGVVRSAGPGVKATAAERKRATVMVTRQGHRKISRESD